MREETARTVANVMIGAAALGAAVVILRVPQLRRLAFAVLPALPSRANLVSALKEGGAAVSGAQSCALPSVHHSALATHPLL